MTRILEYAQIWISKHDRQIVVAICLLVFFAGVIYSYSQGNILKFPDEKDHVTLARNLAKDMTYTLDGQTLTAYRPPGYPLLLSILALLGMDIVSFRILNFILLSLTLFLLFTLIKKIHNPISGVLSVFIALAYVVLFYTAGILVPQTLGAFLLLLTLNLLIPKKSLTLQRSFFIGIITGIHILAIPSSTFLLVPFSGWLFWKKRFSSGVSLVGCFIVGMIIVIAPWSYRNYKVFDSFVFVSTNSGLNLLLGNNENAGPESGAFADINRYRSMTLGMNEARTDAFFSASAMKYIKENKLRSAKMYFLKFLNHFGINNQFATSQQNNQNYEILMLLSYGLILILLIVRLAVIKKFSLLPEEVLFLLIYLSSALFFSIYFTRIRFRLPFDYLIIGVVAMFIANIYEKRVRIVRNTTPLNESQM
jgi:Dolichyl-phosphate-mannose-protein mannosyltransferase